MGPNHRIELLKKLGSVIKQKDWSQFYNEVHSSNPWFTVPAIEMALSGVSRYLESSNFDKWSKSYDLTGTNQPVVALIMAGNIPLVGIHDLICLITAGCRAIIKMSSQDQILLPLVHNELLKLEPRIKECLSFTDNLWGNKLDGIIATGSDNTSRYIDYYYKDIPKIIRSNRTSLAIIRGDESHDQLSDLGLDLFSYFGKGCRNVSKILVPRNYDFSKFILSNQIYTDLLECESYKNNYTYQKALHGTGRSEFIDTGYCLICRSHKVVSPLSVIFYDYYDDQQQIYRLLAESGNKIQCIASSDGWFDSSYHFGRLQKPDLWDYSDNVDTMKFLATL